jgi:hypothetical protein
MKGSKWPLILLGEMGFDRLEIVNALCVDRLKIAIPLSDGWLVTK